MQYARNDIIEHNGDAGRIIAVDGTRVVVQWCDGRLQAGAARGLWMVTRIAEGIPPRILELMQCR